MRFRLVLPMLALVATLLLAIPGAADAKSRWKLGFGDQNPQVFSDPNFKSLKVKKVRRIIPWDFAKHQYQLDLDAAWINQALAAKNEVMVAFEAPRGCYDNGKYSKKKACRVPSVAAYTKAFKAFRKLYPKVKVFQPWNEINSKSQPTAKNPKRAAQYYNAMKKACKKCTVVAADLLDSSSVLSYTKKYRRYLKGSPKIWGIHNYADVNRSKNKGRITKSLMKTLPGQIWATETGGLVKFEKNFPYSLSRANRQTKYMFKLFNSLSKKPRGYRSRITRVYPYTFYGETRDKRFDAGLVNPITTVGVAPSVRASYKTFKKLAKKISR